MQQNGNNNRSSKIIVVIGQAKDKLKLEEIRDHIKNYYDTSFKRTFRLFPILLNNKELN